MADDALFKQLAKIDRAIERALGDGPAATRIGAAELRSRVEATDLRAGGLALPAATEALVSLLACAGLRTGSERFFGYPNPSSDRVSMIADALAARFDAQCALQSSAPAAVELERAALSALAERAGWSMECSMFTTGASESLTTALVAAMACVEPRTMRDGVFALGARPRVYASVEAHRSLQKSTRIVGWGDGAVVEVAAVAPSYAMSVDALVEAITRDRAAGHRPVAVVATVGSTVTGAIDPLDEIATVCAREGLFLYCDAAYGAAAALSDEGRAWVRGIERADAIAWDAHKFPGLALGTGMLWLRERAWATAAFDVDATYVPTLVPSGPAHPYASSMQWSRRAAGLKVWLSLAVDGALGWARAFDERVRLGCILRDGMLAHGWTLRNESPLPVVCATRDGWDYGAYRALAKRLLRERGVWVDVAHTSDGATVFRAAISSSRSTEASVRALLDALGP
jgi:glutamate/tyrosine decarboxylase-like PLP-dependent enzyme